jgi:putative ABC transport system permease protein
MNAILLDLRYAFRQLRRSPGFTFTAIVTLALGLGATAAVYSVIQRVLLTPLPYTDADSLVGLAFTHPLERPNAEQTGGTADFIRQHSAEFSSVAVIDDTGAVVNLSVNGSHAVQIAAMRVSEGYFRTLGVTPALGRAFTPDEDRPGGGRTAVLSDGLWTRVFGRDPYIVGRSIRVNQEAFTVVGVMPAAFSATTETAPGVFGTPDIWQPLQMGPKDPGYDGTNYEMFARLRSGVTLQQAQQQLVALQQPFYAQNPDYKRWASDGKTYNGFRIWKLQDVVVSEVRRSLLTVMGAVLAVLLVACLNLAGLMLARTMRRSREISLRTALGATRMQLFRLLGAEGLLLALGGGLAALLVSRVAASVLLHSAPLAIPTLLGEPGLLLQSATVLGFALISTCIFSVLPAAFILRRRGSEARLGGKTLGETASHARISRVLMIGQIALAMVLVSTASVLMGTFVKLRTIPSGVEPKQLTIFQVALKGDKYASTQHTTQFVASVVDRLSHTPGVDRVAAVNGLPLDRGLNMGAYPSTRRDLRHIVEFRPITPGYFDTMGINLLAGRNIADSDGATGEPVVVIGATAAKKWWPGKSPIGESIRLGNEKNWRIVGVVADVQMHSLVETDGIVVYAPMVQLSDEFTGIVNNWFPTTFAIRTATHVNIAQAAQHAVEQADPEIPVARLSTMQAVINSSLNEPRFFSLLATGFSAFALVLTVIGLFGLLSYQVAQRTREIGVRMALGADRKNILLTFLGRGLAVSSIGVAVGLLATWLLHPVVNQVLADAGVDATSSAQALIMNGIQAALLAAFTILIATLAASWLPARRAASIEPMQALRTD